MVKAVKEVKVDTQVADHKVDKEGIQTVGKEDIQAVDNKEDTPAADKEDTRAVDHLRVETLDTQKEANMAVREETQDTKTVVLRVVTKITIPIPAIRAEDQTLVAILVILAVVQVATKKDTQAEFRMDREALDFKICFGLR